MIQYKSFLPSLIKFTGTEFSGGGGILDTNSTDVLKAFQDINNRLDIASASYDGLMTSAQFTKLNSLTVLPTPSVKGDILVFNGTSWEILPTGTDGQILTCDSTTATGVKWANTTIG